MNNLIKQTARKLRKNQTKSEAILWQVVRNRKLLGKKFLRQHPIVFMLNRRKRFFVADFYCHEAKLVIEVDGGMHDMQKDYDKKRESILKSLGIKVVRFKNQKVIHDLDNVIKRISFEFIHSSSAKNSKTEAELK